MRAHGTSVGALCSLAVLVFVFPPSGTETLAELQGRFDRETNAVHKAKLLERLGDAQFEAARSAEQAHDSVTVGLTLEKYRDNVRAALEALKKQHPNAEKHSNGYRQLQIHVRKGIREVEETLLVAPEPYKPPLEIVRHDLIAMDDELLKMLFPARPGKPPGTPPASEKQP
jgi:hypothetical protein